MVASRALILMIIGSVCLSVLSLIKKNVCKGTYPGHYIPESIMNGGKGHTFHTDEAIVIKHEAYSLEAVMETL